MKFNSRNQTRIWYHVPTKTMRFVLEEGSRNHTQDVLNHPDIFNVDLSKINMDNITEYTDYNGEVLYAAMKNNWIRSAINSRDPQKQSNIEGIDEKNICSALEAIDNFVDGFQSLSIIYRFGTGKKDGKVLYLINRDDIEYCLKWKKFQPHNYYD
jgi:hypothetical protein